MFLLTHSAQTAAIIFNKGAVEFMALVEKAIANEQAVKFEDLVV